MLAFDPSPQSSEHILPSLLQLRASLLIVRRPVRVLSRPIVADSSQRNSCNQLAAQSLVERRPLAATRPAVIAREASALSITLAAIFLSKSRRSNRSQQGEGKQSRTAEKEHFGDSNNDDDKKRRIDFPQTNKRSRQWLFVNPSSRIPSLVATHACQHRLGAEEIIVNNWVLSSLCLRTCPYREPKPCAKSTAYWSRTFFFSPASECSRLT